MNTGLSAGVIASIVGVFSHFPAVQQAILYGSRAKGNFKPGSDIDLTLIGEDLDLTVLGRIEDELDELLLPIQIDLSLHGLIKSEALLDHIKRVGIRFYERECGSVGDTKAHS